MQEMIPKTAFCTCLSVGRGIFSVINTCQNYKTVHFLLLLSKILVHDNTEMFCRSKSFSDQRHVRGISTEGQKAQKNIFITLNVFQKLHSPYRSIHKCINSDLTNIGNTRKRDKELPINQLTDVYV